MNSVLKPYLRSLLIVSLISTGTAWAEALTPAEVEVFKSPSCGCCGKWIEHLQQNGFQVSIREVNDIPAARKKLGMPDRLGSCHTARIGDYIIEGHVPAADIQRMLKEKSQALGLAVPSMPPGSPGMETAKPVPYETLLVQADGSTRVFAKH
ncbi:MAG: DUF411 domain-containing protein [Methylicorpusculum sp.]|jgi:hypothetical protein|uniref:DUF411 domain-containing protein n=1 Tax=Methylicorpusculum TaxID=2713642 RepID=UPI00135B6B07|nr:MULTISPECIES: DUF411 domain-containing protein [Methylicorpusculum]MCD2452102.1 DUF411 domain-containing protein [Methylicorpusculum oleiharenae]MDP2203442.1 DUF411 domain-containing protein [Methylicorpusculum sp.]